MHRSLTEQKRLRKSWQAFHKWVRTNCSQWVMVNVLYPPPTSPNLWRIPLEVRETLTPLIEQHDPPRATGRPRIDTLVTLEAIIHQQRTDIAWNKLPVAFPDYRSVHRTFQRWQELGLLRRIWPILQAEWADLPALH